VYQDPTFLPQLQPQSFAGGFAIQPHAQSQTALPTVSPVPLITPGQHPQHANTWPVVGPSNQGGFQTPRAPAAHAIPHPQQQTTAHPHHGIDAHKIGEYADTALKVGTAAFKLFKMAETLTGDNDNGGNSSF
jgi:hypothetical protein